MLLRRPVVAHFVLFLVGKWRVWQRAMYEPFLHTSDMLPNLKPPNSCHSAVDIYTCLGVLKGRVLQLIGRLITSCKGCHDMSAILI